MYLKVHVGKGQWIASNQWNYCFGLLNPTTFIRELARVLFGLDTLKKSSVTGRVSNRNARQNPGKKWEILDPIKLEAIRGE